MMNKEIYEVHVRNNGYKEWFQNDKRHRLDGIKKMEIR